MADGLASPPGSDRARETDIWSEASTQITGERKKKKKNKRKRRNSEGESNDDSCLLDIIKQQSITIKNLQMQISHLTKILKIGEFDSKNQQHIDDMLIESVDPLTTNDDENFPELPRQEVSQTQTSVSNATQNQIDDSTQMDVSDADQALNSKYAWLLRKTNRNDENKGKVIKPLVKNAGQTAPSLIKTTTTTTTTKITNDKKTNMTPSGQKPAPIYLREKCSSELISLISSIIGSGNFYAASINRPVPETKIQVTDELYFRKITAEFEKLDKNFYTFQLKSERGLAVVIRGIEPEVPVDEIKEALEKEGFVVKNVHNIVNRFKVQQPLHLISLDPDAKKPKKSDVHPIYKLSYLLHRKIKVEEPRRRSGPVQCFNCQEYGHTKSYCQLPTVCVICGDNHSSADCKTDKKDPKAKMCKNCGGNHTANFRGCAVYMHIKNKTKNDHPKTTEKTASSRVRPGTTYAQATSTNTNLNDASSNAPPQTEIMMTMLSTFLSSMQNMMTQMTTLMSSK